MKGQLMTRVNYLAAVVAAAAAFVGSGVVVLTYEPVGEEADG